MPSNTRPVREAQKASFEKAIADRRAMLKGEGRSDAEVRKDPRLNHVKAQLRKTLRRIEAIGDREKLNAALARRKQEKAQAKAEGKAPEEKAAAPEAGKKAKKKKEKKKES